MFKVIKINDERTIVLNENLISIQCSESMGSFIIVVSYIPNHHEHIFYTDKASRDWAFKLLNEKLIELNRE